ncbi:hypothetical protein PRIPAC_88701 [Pristionchus pacificus]|uniref:glucuronosyltransferase n=1 Tax=Pristionchus pacificus TaxID=54126 RepID=A0A2A6CZ09_PRIPA|nr:hypothetical protein PRIPAC_88701 [Pristionchus pacificus]|eukprot:PDM83454.1 glucuronosyltransferase [Pristionchus pacificus]
MLSLRFFLLFLPSVLSFKILVYNAKFAHSHSKYMGAIADTLMEAGHHVISLMPVIDPSVPDYTKTKIIRLERTPEVTKHLSNFHEINFFTIPVDEYTLPWTMGPPTAGLFGAMCNRTLSEPGLVDQLKAEKFDVMITENGDYCGVGLSHLIQPPSYVTCSSNVMMSNIARDIGIPLPRSYIPSYSTLRIDPHSMWSRAKNWINHLVMQTFHDMPRDSCQDVFKEKYGTSFPDFAEITSKSSLILTNQEPVIDIAFPTLKKVIDLGGIVASVTKPLNEHWLSILSLRSRSVIFSFGSIARSTVMPIDAKRGIIKAMSSFPDITFIWKYETPEDDFAVNEVSKVKNIVLTKWMPQNDLLNDKRVVAFVSHAGAEQPRNAAAVARTGMALVYDKHELWNGQKLTESLKTSSKVGISRFSSIGKETFLT